jgi:hypothetical protein
VDNAHCTIFKWVESTVTTFVKVQKSSLMISILIGIKCGKGKSVKPFLVRVFHSPKK